MHNGLLVKYGEIAIKGNNRHQFENLLIRNIKEKLAKVGTYKVSKEQGRIFIEPENGSSIDDIIAPLQKVFGIIGLCPASVFTDDSMESICEQTIAHLKEDYGENPAPVTFKVEARRANKKYPLNSLQIAAEVGSKILEAFPNWSVDVHHPQVTVWTELRNRVYVFSKVIPGLGGMPVSSHNKAALLLSGGIDSPVAGWMIAKRGVELCAIYFHAHPYTTDRAKDKVVELARRVSEYSGRINLYVVPFTDIQLDIYDRCPQDQLTIIMRRIMMRISEKIAEKEGAMALITGENLGQVASQTLQSMYCTNEVCTMPVYRPLIGFDKQEIVEIAQKIDTFETSILPYEDCCTIFVAKHPETKPKLESIKKSETHLTDIEAAIEKAVNDSEIIKLRLGEVLE
ncbi:MAG: tRNA 4-thiouridine(8) synthase ThiI [Firmicutes bacterium]|nr:tRNA 4-thiouridine(8) synthase ThiI [Bacillota bacterium]